MLPFLFSFLAFFFFFILRECFVARGEVASGAVSVLMDKLWRVIRAPGAKLVIDAGRRHVPLSPAGAESFAPAGAAGTPKSTGFALIGRFNCAPSLKMARARSDSNASNAPLMRSLFRATFLKILFIFIYFLIFSLFTVKFDEERPFLKHSNPETFQFRNSEINGNELASISRECFNRDGGGD